MGSVLLLSRACFSEDVYFERALAAVGLRHRGDADERALLDSFLRGALVYNRGNIMGSARGRYLKGRCGELVRQEPWPPLGESVALSAELHAAQTVFVSKRKEP